MARERDRKHDKPRDRDRDRDRNRDRDRDRERDRDRDRGREHDGPRRRRHEDDRDGHRTRGKRPLQPSSLRPINRRLEITANVSHQRRRTPPTPSLPLPLPAPPALPLALPDAPPRRAPAPLPTALQRPPTRVVALTLAGPRAARAREPDHASSAPAAVRRGTRPGAGRRRCGAGPSGRCGRAEESGRGARCRGREERGGCAERDGQEGRGRGGRGRRGGGHAAAHGLRDLPLDQADQGARQRLVRGAQGEEGRVPAVHEPAGRVQSAAQPVTVRWDAGGLVALRASSLGTARELIPCERDGG